MNKNKKSRHWKRTLLILFGISITLVFYNAFKTPVPLGTSQKGEIRDSEVKFIYDLTYEKDGQLINEQNIFPKIKEIIADADDFIVLDMFLFNDDHDHTDSYQNIAGELTDALIAKKNKNPELKIVFITDEINTFYGSYSSIYLEKLKKNDIQLVITELEKLRDPNPLYAGLWRSLFKNISTNGAGWLPNPFSADSPKVSLASYLKLLNMKANHRKVLITENEAIVTSFNPHDASSNHSNIALLVKGEIINDLLETENAVVKFSGGEPFDFEIKNRVKNKDKAQVLTEGKIKQELVKEIKAMHKGDKIQMAMFYLADYQIIEELIKASERDVEIKIILDANKDAFGRKKNGVPNRPVAYKLTNDSQGKIAIRWYNTHSEQFHSKITIFSKNGETVIIGGSANLTRRNLEDYNLETNLKVVLSKESPEAIKIENYFERIWTNEDAEYSLDFEVYKENSIFKNSLYYIQEKTGLSSF